MKRSILFLTAVAALGSYRAHAATPEQEKAFVESYRKALESKDEKTLVGFLYTEGLDEEAIGFFKMMQAIDPGAKIVSIEFCETLPRVRGQVQQADDHARRQEIQDAAEALQAFGGQNRNQGRQGLMQQRQWQPCGGERWQARHPRARSSEVNAEPASAASLLEKTLSRHSCTMDGAWPSS